MTLNFSIFEKTIRLCEKVLGKFSFDINEAFDFSKTYYTRIPVSLLTYIEENQDKFEKGSYEKDLIRYIYVKSIENRIAADIFSQTSRGNVCDVFFSPDDLKLNKYPTNLPQHLEVIVNNQQSVGNAIAEAIIDEDKTLPISIEMLMAITCFAHNLGFDIGENNKTYKTYNCSDLLTRNELFEIAGNNLCNVLHSKGFTINEVNFSRDTYQNIVAEKGDCTYYFLISTEITPKEPGFEINDINALYEVSIEKGALPCYASISLRSSDKKHANDGVILAGDEVQFMINAIEELKINKEEKDPSKRYLSRDLSEEL